MRSLASLFSPRNRSAQTAKERLRLVLIHDRSSLPPGVMETLRDELIEVISRHVDVDRAAVRLEITQDGRAQRLLADIPLKRIDQPLPDL
ncbi:MAG TPA: cell division topological specificity factor MinE [Anaerolineales bacterium]|nr:cell division topological specificity factor MinE [Anaerolineales bacterium]